MEKPIVVVGSINLDLVVAAERIPRVGETVMGSTFASFPGGKGANQAVAIAKLGYPVALVGCVGSDAYGAPLRQGLEEAGIDTRSVTTAEGSSGVALITKSARGENSIVVVPGANALVSCALVDQAETLLRSAGMILAQLEIPLETVLYLAELAARYDVPLMLDPAPARVLPEGLLSRVAWLTPNETEIEELLRGTGVDPGDEQAAIARLQSLGVRNVLLKRGERGVVLGRQSAPFERVPAYAVNAVDTTAAGDAFNGGFAVGLLRGWSPRQSALFASAVAAISVTRHGAQASMPSAAEVEEFMRMHRA